MMKKGLLLVLAAMLLLSMSVTAFAAAAPSVNVSVSDPNPKTGDTITVTVTCPGSGGIDARITATGLEYVSHTADGMDQSDAEHIILAGTKVTYTYKVTAKEGETFSFVLSKIVVSDETGANVTSVEDTSVKGEVAAAATKPSEPTKPSETAKPTNPAETTTAAEGETDDVPKTGDETSAMPYVLILVGVAGVAAATFALRRKQGSK